jgi:hypothetical protein
VSLIYARACTPPPPPARGNDSSASRWPRILGRLRCGDSVSTTFLPAVYIFVNMT